MGGAPAVVLAVVASMLAGTSATLLLLPGRSRLGLARPLPAVTVGAQSLISRWRDWAPPLGVGALAWVLAYALLGLALPALMVGALGWAGSSSAGRAREAARRARQRAALVTVVDLLGQLLPAGHGVRQSLQVLADSGPAELRQELGAVVARMRTVGLDQALVESSARVRQPLFTLVATTLAVGGRSGGRLTPLLSELSRAAHQLEATQSQLRAEQAQGRLGALVIASMPLGLIAVLEAVNPSYLDPYRTAGGQLVLTGLLLVIALGYLWMLRILRLPDPDQLPLAEPLDPAGAAPVTPR